MVYKGIIYCIFVISCNRVIIIYIYFYFYCDDDFQIQYSILTYLVYPVLSTLCILGLVSEYLETESVKS